MSSLLHGSNLPTVPVDFVGAGSAEAVLVAVAWLDFTEALLQARRWLQVEPSVSPLTLTTARVVMRSDGRAASQSRVQVADRHGPDSEPGA